MADRMHHIVWPLKGYPCTVVKAWNRTCLVTVGDVAGPARSASAAACSGITNGNWQEGDTRTVPRISAARMTSWSILQSRSANHEFAPPLIKRGSNVAAVTTSSCKLSRSPHTASLSCASLQENSRIGCAAGSELTEAHTMFFSSSSLLASSWAIAIRVWSRLRLSRIVECVATRRMFATESGGSTVWRGA